MALTRITKGVIKPNENYDTHNINSTGIVTAIGLDVNGNGDISGNLNVGGVLTYEDVTSIDSVGIITAQSDIHVGAGVSVVGIVTAATGDFFDLDVDGHTELDNVNVSGVVTFTNSPNAIQMNDNGRVSFGTSLKTSIAYNSSSSRTQIRNWNDTLEIGYRNTEIHHTNQVRLSFLNGQNTFSNNASTTFTGDNYSSLWIPSLDTFRFNDNAKLAFGTQADTEFYHNGSNLYLQNDTGHIYIQNNVAADVDKNIYLQAKNGENSITCENDGEVYLFSNQVSANQQKLRTSNTGIVVTGIGTFSDKVVVTGSQNAQLTNNQLIFDRAGTSYIDNTNNSGSLSFRIGSSYTVGLLIDSSANVSIPSKLMHHGDTDTFLEFSSNTINFDTAGSERIRIDSSGRVIIANNGSGGTADVNADNFVVKNYTNSGSCGISILNADNLNSTLYFGNASDNKHAEVVWSDASNLFLIGTSNSGASIKLRSADQSDAVIIDSSQRVGIGTMIPDTLVEIGNAIGTGTANLLKLTSYTNSQSSRPALVFWNNNPNTAQAQISAKGGASYNASKLFFSVANSSRALQDRVCIDEYGTFIIGPGESRRNTKGSNQHQVLLIEGTGNNSTRMSMIRSSNDDNGPEIQLIKTRGTSIGSVTKPNQNDYIGSLVFIGGDDSDLYARGADISVQATGTPANDRIPSDIIFSTTPTSGATSPQQRLRITSEGNVGINIAAGSTVHAKLNIRDTGNDGAISQLIKLGNDSSGAGTGAGIQLGAGAGNPTQSVLLSGFYDGAGTSFTISNCASFNGAQTERLRIYNSGRILIGDGSSEHSPSGNLDIVGDTNSNGPELYLRVSNNNTTDNIGALIFGNNVDKTVCMIRGSTHTANNTGDIEFHTSTSGTMKEKVRIFNDGKVRIQGEEASGNQMYLDIIGNSQTETAGLRLAGCRFIGPESRRMYFELQGNDVSDHFRFITSPNNDRALDSVALHIGNNNRIGMSQADPDAATLHIGNSYATTSSNVALQVGTITGQNRYLAINHFNNQQNFYQMKMRVNDNQMVPILDLGNPYGSNGHGTAINFHGYQDSKVGAIESENTANNSTSSVDMVLRTGAAPKEVLRLQSNGDARFYNGLAIAKVDNDNSGFSKSGFVLSTPAFTEYHYTWSGHSSYTIDLTCASYFSCIWEYFQHQTNGGSRMQQYARGKWSNNHYQHTLNVWEWSGSGGGLSVSFTASDQGGSGSINGLSNMSNNGSTYSGFTNGGGEGSSSTANGRFRISETYNWGSVSSRALIVRVTYGSFNISKS